MMEEWKCDICGCNENETVKKYTKKNKFKMNLCNKHYCQMVQKGCVTDKSKSRRHEHRICDICESDDRVTQHTKDDKYNGYLLCIRHSSQVKAYGEILTRTKFDKNEVIKYDSHAEVVLYDIKNRECERVILNLEDVDDVVNYKWYLGKNGYATRDVKDSNSKIYLHHSLVGNHFEKGMVIDHINRNKLDNRRCNLRIVNSSSNGVNKGVNSANSSGVTGVNEYKGRWQSRIGYLNKTIHIGTFNTKEEAIIGRLKAELKYYPDYPPQKHLFEKYDIKGEY